MPSSSADGPVKEKGSPTTSHKASLSSSSSSKDGGFASLFHRDHHHHHPIARDSALAHMLAPAMQVAGAHNPFAINALCEDGSRKKTHTYGKGDKHSNKTQRDSVDSPEDRSGDTDEVEAAESYHRRPRRRDRIRSAFGRSLSPWRYHNLNAPERRHGWNLSRQSRDSLDVQREKTDKLRQSEGTEAESDGESVRSGIVPRNNAFGNFSEDSDSEDEMGGVDGHHHHHDRRSRNPATEPEAAKTTNEKIAEKVGEPAATESAIEGDPQVNDEAEDSDDYLDFDEETLDNTLYNAGCIDLHDAWLKDDHAPDAQTLEGKHVSHNHAHYGPDDYDAAWGGAGPSGHDEADEGLRAPNVVIGQGQSMSPSALAGEGMDVLTISNQQAAASHRPVSHASSVPSAEEKTIATATTTTNTSASDSISTSVKTKTDEEVHPNQRLTASRPIFEKNRCTITLVHGEYDRMCVESKRQRRYIVASDGSEESSYAIEWTIGTVLRDGDEMLVVSVMETDTKLDAGDARHEDPIARREHQRIRQSMAVILARRAVAVLQRTRLAVRVSCQALHARNSRHMFIDMIDFFEPTMCVVGSRGLGSLKGVLLGSFSHYCVQKSPVPVMVARKRLKLPPLPRGKVDVVSNVRARHMRLDQAMIEKEPNVSEDAPKEGEGTGEEGKEKSDGATSTADETERGGKDDMPETLTEGQDVDSLDRGGRDQQQEEESAIRRDAAQATELQEKEKWAAEKKQAKKEKDLARDASQEGRGKKKFSLAGGEEDQRTTYDDADS